MICAATGHECRTVYRSGCVAWGCRKQNPHHVTNAAEQQEELFKRRLDACVRDAFRAVWPRTWRAQIGRRWCGMNKGDYELVLGLWRVRNGYRFR